eukprot:TRINITY_DN83409_c0_g1_i1.p1 TRINITY_DN83409_c0_g1~~TRINITY_DN83409_c0_g1_i1.p1  ORF type:complete len:313 (+),score=37.86 TRINITY_DN83409_c0_g1_i1:101-1039(+)
MNFNNATYDVLWRAPDGGLGSVGVPCCSDNKCERWCQNSSWPPFGGSWSMWPRMKTATSSYKGGWSVEIAFPLREEDGIGGLLSGPNGNLDEHDPNRGAPQYWSIDFSRAEHPFFTSNPALFPPLCSQIRDNGSPTLLGTDQWSCYWEWTWQSVGGHRYMHNPESFGFLQFAENGQDSVCGNFAFPVRYLLAQIYQAQVAFVIKHGMYAEDLKHLTCSTNYCNVDNGCSRTDLEKALEAPFQLTLDVKNQETHCVKYGQSAQPTGGPCFRASVILRLPDLDVEVSGSISENRYLDVKMKSGKEKPPPCLRLS